MQEPELEQPRSESVDASIVDPLGFDPIVVVETDPSVDGYDQHLARWLGRLRRAPGVPFPSRVASSPAEWKSRYPMTGADDLIDRDWWLSVRLPAGAIRDSRGGGASLVRWRVGAHVRIEIDGHLLAESVRLPEWLDRWVAARGDRVVSSRPFHCAGMSAATGEEPEAAEFKGGPLCGDVLVHRGADHDLQIGRIATRRFGERVFVLQMFAPRANYAEQADGFVVARDSLLPIRL
ncbi:MAG: hypothetical protein AB8H80_08285 [Planctomycetota bacterium]